MDSIENAAQSPRRVVTPPPVAAFSITSPSRSMPAITSSNSGPVLAPNAASSSDTANAMNMSVGSTIAQQRAAAGLIQRAISPPTPAPSPQPETRTLRHSIINADNASIVDQQVANESPLLKLFLREFPTLEPKERHAFLASFVDLCNSRELAHLSTLISPRLKVDFLSALPIEVSLHILSFLDDPRTLARASGVSRFWRSLVNDEQTWKVMCKRYRFRQVPLNPSRSQMLGVETPDQTMEPALTEEEYVDLPTENNSPVESSRVLGSLYETYRARGLDPTTALAELKTLHNLFLSKRAREIGMEERRRQLHSLQHDNVFVDMLQDKAFVTRMSDNTISEEDRRFYEQLELFVQEASTDSQTDAIAGPSSARSHEGSQPDSSGVGWLSTGPPSTRTMGGEISGDPRTPVTSTSSRYFNPTSSIPLREMGRNLVSPTSRLGSMTSGLLTSLWDRTGSNAIGGNAAENESNQPPSVGDHGHSTEGHHDPEDEDVDMAEEQSSSAREDSEAFTRAHSDATSIPQRNGSSSSKVAGASSSSRRRPRFAPFARPGSEDEHGSADASQNHSIGMGKPIYTSQAHKKAVLRSASAVVSTSEAGRSLGALGLDANDNTSKPFQSALLPTPKRSISTGHFALRAGRKNKPFSYKTHFKLAYQTESNWLRGGRLLTQHVSSDDASGEGATVTSLSIDDDWIIVGMANARIHVFDAKTGLFVQTLSGHTAGVWCMALISASGSRSNGSTKTNLGKGKSRNLQNMEEDDDSMYMPAQRYAPFMGMRNFSTPTPDLNLIHHDPRPAASVFSPEMRAAQLDAEFSESQRSQPSLPMPHQNTLWNQERSTRSIHESLHSSRTTPSNEDHFSSSSPSAQSGSAFEAAAEAAATARAARMAGFEEEEEGTPRNASNHTSRGAGLGSNFGSPCGSVAGYGNEHAIVVSSGCDRDVRVWDLSTGECKFVLTGHRSTVRCLRVFEGRPIAISGSRDGTMRVWNVETGQLQHLLPGHQHSVRCLDLAGNLVASASYDCTARIWNVDTGKCLHVLRGHYHQLYAIAFDGVHVATGSLDTTVRIWDAKTGECLAIMQAHSSLVGQLQLTDSTLITGGSDGKVIVYSLKTMKTLYQLLAHDENTVTSLQFDDRFIVTGGNDGKVKLWNFRTGEFVRELCEASDQVWKVSFRDDKCVVLCKRNGKTAMDVISFRPIEESA